jgi:hypothetical protein
MCRDGDGVVKDSNFLGDGRLPFGDAAVRLIHRFTPGIVKTEGFITAKSLQNPKH